MVWKIVGIMAAVSTTSGLIPQIIRGIRTKELEDVSPVMCMFMIFGIAMWLSYGIHLKDAIIIGANAVSLLLGIFILILRSKYIRQRKREFPYEEEVLD